MTLALDTPQARWVIAATVLGSGVVFLDGTIVNVALPAISEDLDTSISGLQWVLDAYLVTLSALVLLGGSLGDRLGRRRLFVYGLVGFSAASALCAVSTSTSMLIAARALQGVAGALLVPGSLAIIAATFQGEDRGRAIGMWSGLAGVASALGPFVGGWLIDSVSWRLVFLLNLPLAAIAAFSAIRHVPESRADIAIPIDLPGATTATVGLGAIAFAAIETDAVAGAIGVLCIAAFVVIELRSTHPMLPLGLFRSRQFTGANLTTLLVYGALGGALFLLVLQLQFTLGYSALEAGAALLPFTVVMFALSPTAGRIGQQLGPRLPMTVGPLVSAVGLFLMARIDSGSTYFVDVLPSVLVFALGMTITVAPLTAAVLGSVDESRAGIASGVNNAVARLAGLIAIAVLPTVAGIASQSSMSAGLDAGYSTAVYISAALCAAGGVLSALVLRAGATTKVVAIPSPIHPCGDPCLATQEAGGRSTGSATVG